MVVGKTIIVKRVGHFKDLIAQNRVGAKSPLAWCLSGLQTDFGLKPLALAVYQAIRRDGTQKHVLATMQNRADLYQYLDYHAYEQKLDELFAATRESSQDPGQ